MTHKAVRAFVAQEMKKAVGPKYPNIKVKLVGKDGNALLILGLVVGALRMGGVSEEERKEFMTEAMKGNYDHLLQTALKTVTVT